MLKTQFIAVSFLMTIGCGRSGSPPEPSQQEPVDVPAEAPTEKTTQKAAEEPKPAAVAAPAKVGASAPSFSLPNLQGDSVKLEDFRGKLVVLEWFNPECPYVKAAHTGGSLIDTASKLTEKGVVYLAINSGGPGRQGHGVDKNVAGKERFKLDHPILLDESGEVGRAYGATNTPHFLILLEYCRV